MKQKNTSNRTGIGFTGLLAILFIALKLTGQIDWSWWWVLAPIWLPVFIILITTLIIYVIFQIFKK